MSRGVLVTGATTPLGRLLCARLAADPDVHRVLAVGREPEETCGLEPAAGLLYRRVDLSRARAIRDLLFGPAEALGIDAICHLSMHRSAAIEGRRAHALNVDALRTILGIAERHPTIRRLVLRSDACVYRIDRDLPAVVAEDHPLRLGGRAPQWLRDRVEADVTACARTGLGKLEIAVLRLVEVLAPRSGSQLHDYLSSSVCLRPLGFDPMMSLLSLQDAAGALAAAVGTRGAQGVFNIPGVDTLPLSECIRRSGRVDVALPGLLLEPAYRLRALVWSADFRYALHRSRFRYPAVLDGSRAARVLGYVPSHPLEWPA